MEKTRYDMCHVFGRWHIQRKRIRPSKEAIKSALNQH